ncbi:Abi family protein [Halopseudomonas xiamenensis]|uniref:Abi family protein n=1 Tax=Halopseudomonas xiamenensis TaxID=157792 RepID=UPI0016291204|nr:Abi family protein [Halopseudomonas xiamenensis]
MQIVDPARAERKLAQLGYYRLSGYWYPAREFAQDAQGQKTLCPHTRKPLRLEHFQAGTVFSDAVILYQFDKRLRLLMLDAIERLEVNIRSVIAHEVGYHNPMAYTDQNFIRPKQARNFHTAKGKLRNKWTEWLARQQDLLNRSTEDCIEWHRLTGRPIPFWVAVEAWDFGTLSRYFEMLKGSHQNRILRRFGLNDAKIFARWLQEINLLRNRCAHHSRIWNQVSPNALSALPNEAYFQKLNLDHNALTRIYGVISIMWFLLRRVAPNSSWICDVADLIDSKPGLPGCTFTSLGLPAESGFPRQLFGV